MQISIPIYQYKLIFALKEILYSPDAYFILLPNASPNEQLQ